VKGPTTQKVERFTKVEANQILTNHEGAGMVAAVGSAKPKSFSSRSVRHSDRRMVFQNNQELP
jgi:hypothetical protein